MPDVTEHFGAVITLEYLGSEQVNRYLADLQRIKAITAEAAAGFSATWQAAATGTMSYADAIAKLNQLTRVGAAQGNHFQKLLADVSAAKSGVLGLNTAVEQLNRSLRQGGVSAAQLRQGLMRYAATAMGTAAAQNPTLVNTAPSAAELRAFQAQQQQAVARVTQALQALPTSVGGATGAQQPAIETAATIRARAQELALIQAENAARQRSLAFEDRVAAAAERLGGQVGFAPTGQVSAISTTVPGNIDVVNQLNRQIGRLNDQIDEIEQTTRSMSMAEARRQTIEVNSAILQARVNAGLTAELDTFERVPTSVLATGRMSRNVAFQLSRQGGSDILEDILGGGGAPGVREYFYRTRGNVSIPVEGLTTPADMLAASAGPAADAVMELAHNIDQLKSALADAMTPLGAATRQLLETSAVVNARRAQMALPLAGQGFTMTTEGEVVSPGRFQMLGPTPESVAVAPSALTSGYAAVRTPSGQTVLVPTGRTTGGGGYQPPYEESPFIDVRIPTGGGYGGRGGYYTPGIGGAGGVGGAGGGGGGFYGGPPPYQPGGGNFWSNFSSGFMHGRYSNLDPEVRDSLGFQVGQTAKFTVLYGTAYKALYGIAMTFNAALRESKEFQNALVDLNIATGRAGKANEQLADQLGQVVSAAGLNPAEGVTLGARSIGLFGLNQAPAAVQRQAAIQSARTTAMVSLGAGEEISPQEIQADLAAIANGFRLGPGGQSYIGDLDAYFSRKFGIAPGSSMIPVAQTAALGQSAGFGLEEQMAIAADIQSRTGMEPWSTGQLLAQLLTRSGGANFITEAGKYNINTNQSLRNVILQLSRLYPTLSARQQIAINESIGGVGSQGVAASVLLEDLARRIEPQVRAAQGGAAGGTLERQFEARMKTIGGQIAILGSDFKEFALLLGQSGAINVLGLFVQVLEQGLDVANALLREFDSLPAAVRDVTLGMLALAAAQKVGLISFTARKAAGLDVLGYDAALGYGALGPESSLAARLMRPGATVGTAETVGGVVTLGEEAAGAAAGAGLLRTAGAAALGTGRGLLAALGGPIGAGAIAGIVALGAIKSSTDKMREAEDESTATLQQFSRTHRVAANLTPQDLRAAASAADQDRQTALNAGGGLGNIVTLGYFGRQAQSLAAVDEANRRYFAQQAAVLQGLTRQESSGALKPTLSSLASSDVTTWLSGLAAGGMTASQQLRELTKAVDDLGYAGQQARERFRPSLYAGGVVGSIETALQGGRYRQFSTYVPPSAALTGLGAVTTSRIVTGADLGLKQLFEKNVTLPDLNKAILAAVRDQGITSAGQLGPRNATLVSRETVDAIAKRFLANSGLSAAQREQALEEIRKAIRKYLLDQRPVNLARKKVLTDTELTSFAAATLQQVTTAVGELPTTAYNQILAQIRSGMNDLARQIPKDAGRTPGQVIADMDQLRNQYAQTKIAELEALRKVAQHDSSSKAEIRAKGEAFLHSEIAVAVKYGDQDALLQILNAAGSDAIAVARQMIQNAVNVIDYAEKMNAEMASATLSTYHGLLTQHGGPVPGLTAAQQHQLNELHRLEEATHQALSQQPKQDVYRTGGDANLPPSLSPTSTAATAKESAAEINAARAAAEAQKTGSGIAEARAAITQAAADLKSAKKNTVEYYQALGSLYQAQSQLRDAITQYHNNLAELKIDITNPAAEAALAAREAARQLALDTKNNQGPDVIAADKLALEKAQADAESQRFQQRLEAAQTAQQLGQMSFHAYMRYLDNEKDHLEAIKKRTYQQQQELNSVNEAIQSAAQSMQGMFNIGDITLPTPYQVRRSLQRQLQGVVHAIGPAFPGDVQNVEIKIDGADTAKIRAVLSQILGSSAGTTQTARYRKIRAGA